MKKLLLLAILGTMGTSLMGASAGRGPEATSTVEIKAVVLKPLTITNSGDVNFGNIIQNTVTASRPVNFTIDGTAGERVLVKINDQLLSEFTESVLTHSEGTATMPLKVTGKTVSNGDIATPTLGLDGTLAYNISISTQASADQLPGAYTGALTMSARYN